MQKKLLKKLPKPLHGPVKRTLKVLAIMSDQQLGLLAASVAYYGAIAFFPLVVALVAIAGLVIEPQRMSEIVTNMSQVLPSDIASLVSTQLENAMKNKSGNIIVAIIGFAVAIFGVSGVVQTMITATNAAFGIRDKRSAVTLKLISVAFTVGLIIGLAVALPLIFIGRDIFTAIGIPEAITSAYIVLRWLVLIVLTIVGVAIFFHFGPDRQRYKIRWLNPGVVFAALGWLIVSAVFFAYLQYFANFDSSYSLFAGIISLMIWLNLSATIILLGAALNHTYDA